MPVYDQRYRFNRQTSGPRDHHARKLCTVRSFERRINARRVVPVPVVYTMSLALALADETTHAIDNLIASLNELNDCVEARTRDPRSDELTQDCRQMIAVIARMLERLEARPRRVLRQDLDVLEAKFAELEQRHCLRRLD